MPWVGLLGGRCAVMVALALALSLTTAHAQGQTTSHRTILLVRTAGDDPVMNRVRAELNGAGWRVIEIAGQDETETRESLAVLASELKATAALRVDAQIGEICIHIARARGDVDEILRSDDGHVEGRILALRATEALRAHGLDVAPSALPQQPSEAGAPAPSQKPNMSGSTRPGAHHRTARGRGAAASTRGGSAASKHGLWLEFAPTVITSPGGLGYTLSGWVGARLELSPMWSVATTGTVPIWSRQVTEPEGTARVATSSFGVGLEGAWVRGPNGYWATGLGAAGLVTHMKGRQAQTGYRTATDTVISAAVHPYLRGGWLLLPRWTVFGVLLGGMSCPEVAVAFGDRVARTWGRPYGMLALGVEYRPLAW